MDLLGVTRLLLADPAAFRVFGVFEQSSSIKLMYYSIKDRGHRYRVATSDDGFSFSLEQTGHQIKQGALMNEKLPKSEHFRTTRTMVGLAFTYQRHQRHFSELRVALQPSSTAPVKVIARIQTQAQSGMIIPDYLWNQSHAMLLAGKDGLQVAYSSSLKDWEVVETPILQPNEQKDGESADMVVHHIFSVREGIAVLYEQVTPDKRKQLWSLLLDPEDLTRVIWQSSHPVWEQPTDWTAGVESLGGVSHNGQIISYFSVPGQGIIGVLHSLHVLPHPLSHPSKPHIVRSRSYQLAKHIANPIISPNPNNSWEAFTTFNPAAVYVGNKVHIVYRAQGYDYVSVLGYASSSDGFTIDERHNEPCYLPREDFEYTGNKRPSSMHDIYASGGGYGGVEDPRITQIEDRLYMTYVAYDGWSPPRVALTSILVEDFLDNRWLWEKAVLISPPGIVNKNAVIFPEKVRGKYVIFHRVFPDILIDYVDTLELDGSWWLEGHHKISPREDMWDSRKLGAGAPPIKTDKGWLLIYQAVDDRDATKYKMGAMLLDLEYPEKVIARTNAPILEPDQWYEDHGFKSGVAYPCGAVVMNGILHVYYGGADSVVCVATAQLDQFLDDLLHSHLVHLDPAVVDRVL